MADYVPDCFEPLEDPRESVTGKQERLPENHILDTSLVRASCNCPGAEPEPLTAQGSDKEILRKIQLFDIEKVFQNSLPLNHQFHLRILDPRRAPIPSYVAPTNLESQTGSCAGMRWSVPELGTNLGTTLGTK